MDFGYFRYELVCEIPLLLGLVLWNQTNAWCWSKIWPISNKCFPLFIAIEIQGWKPKTMRFFPSLYKELNACAFCKSLKRRKSILLECSIEMNCFSHVLRPSVEKRSFPPPNSLSVVVLPQLQNKTFMHAQQHYEKDFCCLDLSRSRYWFNVIISKLGKKSRFWIKQGLLSLLRITAMCNVKQDKSTTELWSRSTSCRENPYQARLTAYGRYTFRL